MTPPPSRILILASGKGTNFCALAEAIRSHEIKAATVVGLISNRADAGACEHAHRLGIPVAVLPSAPPLQRGERAQFEEDLLALAKGFSPDWICLAGFLLILPRPFVAAFAGRILNVHPSLLPAHPGLNSIAKALKAGDSECGCTIHLVNEEVDAGAILVQRRVKIATNDTVETLTEKVRALEHSAYIEALKRMIEPNAK